MLYAKFVNPDFGMRYDPEKCKSAGLKINERYPVSQVIMSGYYTDIYLEGHEEVAFNSVHFVFDEEGEPIDIYSDPRYNPFLKG